MSSGFSFGSKSTTPGFGQTPFGTQPTGSITFGTPAVQQNPTPFGATQPSTGFVSTSFGTPAFGTPASTTQSSGFSFGTPATTSTGFGFGATPASSAPSSGLAFGAAISSAPAANTTFGFGTPAQAPTGLAFGTPATSTSTGFSFGSNPPAAAGLFGTPASTAAPSFGFATPSAQPTLNLGQTQATTTSGLFNTSTFPFGTVTTTSAPSLNFGFGATTTAAPTFSLTTSSTTSGTGLSFGLTTTTTATQSSGIPFGLGGTTSALSFSKPTAATTTTTSSQPTFGLGGIVQSTPKAGVSSPSKPEVLPRDQQLPNELLQLVDSFKNFAKQQKCFSSDVARSSAKEFKKVAGDIDQVGNLLNEVEKKLQNNRALAEKLKFDTARGLQNIEMAQRTMDTPPGLQYENIMPLAFFKELVDNFEKEMQNLKIQIEYTDKYVRNFDKPMPLTSQDLALGMRRLHETFVALAGRLQTVHSQVESQKEQYLNFRKYMLNDDTNIFETPKQQTDILAFALNNFNYKPPSVASGPSPFSSLSHPSVIQAAVQNQIQTTNAAIATPGNIGFGTTLSSTSGTQSLFGNTSLGTTFGQPSSLSFNASSNNFQLQKPPSGNKRGKSIL